VQGSRFGGAPDSPTLVLVVPAEVLDDNVLHAVLFLRGDRNNLGVVSPGLFFGCSRGLSACDAHDQLTDAGFREVGDGCCAVRDDAESNEVGAWLAQVFQKFPGHFFISWAAFDF